VVTSEPELPQGAFVYPVASTGSRVPVIVALVALVVIAAGAVLWLQRRDPKQTAHETPGEPGTPAHGAMAAVLDDTAGEDTAIAEPEPEPEPEPGPEIDIEPVTAVTRPRGDTRPATPRRPPARVAERSEPPVEASPPPPDPPAERQPTTPPVEPGCDEVACVLEKYARPCCARWKPSGENFKPTTSVSDALGRSQIRAGIDRVKARVIACGEQFAAKGTVTLAASVDPDGNVTELSVESSPDPGLGRCVADVLRKAKFAKTAAGGSFTYPFVF
jgi:TonB family protein